MSCFTETKKYAVDLRCNDLYKLLRKKNKRVYATLMLRFRSYVHSAMQDCNTDYATS